MMAGQPGINISLSLYVIMAEIYLGELNTMSFFLLTLDLIERTKTEKNKAR